MHTLRLGCGCCWGRTAASPLMPATAVPYAAAGCPQQHLRPDPYAKQDMQVGTSRSEMSSVASCISLRNRQIIDCCINFVALRTYTAFKPFFKRNDFTILLALDTLLIRHCSPQCTILPNSKWSMVKYTINSLHPRVDNCDLTVQPDRLDAWPLRSRAISLSRSRVRHELAPGQARLRKVWKFNEGFV